MSVVCLERPCSRSRYGVLFEPLCSASAPGQTCTAAEAEQTCSAPPRRQSKAIGTIVGRRRFGRRPLAFLVCHRKVIERTSAPCACRSADMRTIRVVHARLRQRLGDDHMGAKPALSSWCFASCRVRY